MAKRLKRGFYWRGDTIWLRRDPVTGERTSTRCHDQGAADLFRAERERLAANPAHQASLEATVGEWVARTIKHKHANDKAEGTIHMYKVKLGHIVRLFGRDAALATITPGAVDDYVTTRKSEGVKTNTVARELTCLRQMLRLAKRAGVYALDLDQVMPIGFSANYVPVKRALAAEDLEKLWMALRDDEERAWVAFAIATAADVGDIERARPEDYDGARNVMRIRGTKTGVRDAEIPILPHVQKLFEFAYAHLPLSWERAGKGIGEACKRAGIPHLSPKDLRRTASDWLINSGADQTMVSRFMRHKSDTMVRLVYGHVRPTNLGKLLTPASDVLFAEGTGTLDTTKTEAILVHQRHIDARPLGEIGIRRGLKRLSEGSASHGESDDSATKPPLERADETRSSAKCGTNSAHRESVFDPPFSAGICPVSNSEVLAEIRELGEGSAHDPPQPAEPWRLARSAVRIGVLAGVA